MVCTFTLALFRDMCAVPNMEVYCTYLISCFPVMLLRYFLSDFEMVPVASTLSAIIFSLIFHYYYYYYYYPRYLLYAGYLHLYS
jgi:hypothetical protein